MMRSPFGSGTLMRSACKDTNNALDTTTVVAASFAGIVLAVGRSR
jgi:hypothetical protein